MSRPIDVRNLTMKYADIAALDNVSLRVEQGELLAILGPSGCGKSTLLNLVSGLQKATDGEIWVGEQRIDHLPPQQRGIGFLFQNYALFPNMTVWENVAFGLKIRKIDPTEKRKRVDELLDIVNLREHAHKKPKQLSGGQQQRVALARALAPKPDILLLDEPLSALDVKIRQRLRDEIKNLQVELGITTILVTHDQEEAFELGDRVAVMESGKIVQIDKANIIYDFPATEFVACFVGNINTLGGVVHGGRAYACSMGVDLPDNMRNIPDNTPVRILIRPENLILEKELPGMAAKDVVRGTVKNTVFMGPLIRLDILQDNAQVITAVISKERMEAEKLVEGERVIISAKLCQVVKMSGSGIQPCGTI